MKDIFTLNAGMKTSIQGKNPGARPGFPAAGSAFQVGNHAAFIEALLGRYALETMATTGILAFAAMFRGFAIAVAFAAMHTVAMHLVAGADGCAHAAGRLHGFFGSAAMGSAESDGHGQGHNSGSGCENCAFGLNRHVELSLMNETRC